MNMERQNAIDSAVRALLLNDPDLMDSMETSSMMDFIMQQPVSAEIDVKAEQVLLDGLRAELLQKSFGELIAGQMTAQALTEAELAQRSRLPLQVIGDIRKDKLFTNNIPVMLIKNLVEILQLTFSEVEQAVYKTFDLLKSQAEPRSPVGTAMPAYRKGIFISRQMISESHNISGSKDLFENREALEKYMLRLKDLLEGE